MTEHTINLTAASGMIDLISHVSLLRARLAHADGGVPEFSLFAPLMSRVRNEGTFWERPAAFACCTVQ